MSTLQHIITLVDFFSKIRSLDTLGTLSWDDVLTAVAAAKTFTSAERTVLVEHVQKHLALRTKESDKEEEKPPVTFMITKRGFPAIHLTFEKPTLAAIEARVLEAYGVDVTKRPAYLLYRFPNDLDAYKMKHWFMMTKQEELDYVIQRVLKGKSGLVALNVTSDFKTMEPPEKAKE
jgi:hypothetical protein